MTTRTTRRMITAAATAVAASAALAGSASAAPEGSGCNTTDITGISACYVNDTGGGYSVSVYNHRSNAVAFLPGNLTVLAGRSGTYTSSSGQLDGVTLSLAGSGDYIGSIPVEDFTEASP